MVLADAILRGLVEQTVLRRRLPDIDSADYYMTTRFSDIASFIASTLVTVLFPFTAALAAEGKPTRPLVGAAVLLFVTGYMYFADYLPASWTSFLATHNFNSLKAMLWWFTVTTLTKAAFSMAELLRQDARRT